MKTILISIILSLVILGDSGLFVYDMMHSDQHNLEIVDNPIEEESKESKESIEKDYVNDTPSKVYTINSIDSWNTNRLSPCYILKSQLFKEIPKSPPEL